MVDGDDGEVGMMTKLTTRDDMESMSPCEYDRRQNEQYDVFEGLCSRVDKLLERFGRPDFLPGQRDSDYHVHDDYSEYPQVVVFVENMALLRMKVVNALQELVREFPGWQIDLMVTLRGHEDWPNMGISIRADEIVDDLQRQYFPPEYQTLEYENPGQG